MSNNPTRAAGLGTALLMAGLILGVGATDVCAAKKPPKPSNNIHLVPTITAITVTDAGGLLATGTATAVINGKSVTSTFTAPVTLSATPNALDPACPILNLQLNEINLDLLGLVVTTSDICLAITAHQGGGLLGDLLCGVSNLLNNGVPLSSVLSGLPAADLDTVLGGLTGLLNGALGNLVDAVLAAILPGAGGSSCDILHLELGPLDLNLLGLQVVLDDCQGGPVVVDIAGERGQGNLLGNLLCGLLGDGLINLGATLQQLLQQILGALA